MKKIFKLYMLVLTVPAMTMVSCKKFVETETPYTQLSSASAFKTDNMAEGALNGLYNFMIDPANVTSGSIGSITLQSSLYADELIYTGTETEQQQLAENSLLPANTPVYNFWTQFYNLIYACNSILEGVPKSTGMSAAKKQQALGEAKFVRAFCHFYLLNYFGDIPSITTTDYKANTLAFRTETKLVYDQIVSDLSDAKQMLGADYVTGAKRIRPNKYTAAALLARVYLYRKDYSNAEKEASLVIDQSSVYSLESSVSDVFLTGSKEAIWQLQLADPVVNPIYEAQVFMDNSEGWHMRDELMNSFEAGDLRVTNWIGAALVNGVPYLNPRKYKSDINNNNAEAYVMFRLAEQYLIRAEARAQQNNLHPVTGALADLNMIRVRAGLSALAGLNQSQALDAVAAERRHEFFCEWGHRWMDLKRTGKAAAAIAAIKPATWQTTDLLFPIPQVQIDNDPNIKQNPGY